MKKIFAFITAAMLMLSFSACGSSKQPDTDEVKKQLLSDIEFTDMEEIDKGNFDTFYNIDMDKIESFSASYAGSGGSADEVAVFKTKSSSDASAVKDMLNKRVEKRSKDFAGYAPDEEEKIKNSVVKVKGNYVLFCISPDSSKATKIFEDSFK